MNRKSLSLFVAPIVALLFTAVSLDANAGFAAIFGTVKDKETQQPIGGARLQMDIHTELVERHSHANGVYLMVAPNGDSYTLRVYMQGYQVWVKGNITLPDNAQMVLDPELERLPPPPPKVNYARLRKLNYSRTPYRRFGSAQFRLRGAPANPELTGSRIWIFPSEENQFVAQIEIKGSGLDAIEELGVYDEAGEMVPNVKIDVSSASPESIVIEYQLRDQSSANLVRSIQLRAGEETFGVPIRHDFY